VTFALWRWWTNFIVAVVVVAVVVAVAVVVVFAIRRRIRRWCLLSPSF
jgi:hypothetical protein